MMMEKAEFVRHYRLRVKALIQKLRMNIAPSVQVEWYVAGCRMDNFEVVKNWFLIKCYSLVFRMGFS